MQTAEQAPNKRTLASHLLHHLQTTGMLHCQWSQPIFPLHQLWLLWYGVSSVDVKGATDTGIWSKVGLAGVVLGHDSVWQLL